MNVETIKIHVDDAITGMHVVKLDRPWLETPFKLQGFLISSREELQTLKKYCRHIYIDTRRGILPPKGQGKRVVLDEHGEVVLENTFIPATANQSANKKRVSREAHQYKMPPPAVVYEIQSDFESELSVALKVVGRAKATLKTFMTALTAGESVKLDNVRTAAAELEACVLRNPDPAMLLRALRSDEPFSFRHCVHSAVLGIALARELGFKKQNIHELAMGTMLADMGKMKLPKHLLRTTRRLDAKETQIMQQHVPYGVEIAKALDGLTPGTIEIIASHHERFNGSGYPSGLRGGEIPMLARVAGLADSFDAITSERAYSEPIPVYEAIQEMYAATVDVFQRDMVEALIQALGAYPVGSLVLLSDGTVAIVVALNRHRRLLPVVIRLTDADKHPLAEFSRLDLAAGEKAPATVKDLLDPGQFGVEQPTVAILGTQD